MKITVEIEVPTAKQDQLSQTEHYPEEIFGDCQSTDQTLVAMVQFDLDQGYLHEIAEFADSITVTKVE